VGCEKGCSGHVPQYFEPHPVPHPDQNQVSYVLPASLVWRPELAHGHHSSLPHAPPTVWGPEAMFAPTRPMPVFLPPQALSTMSQAIPPFLAPPEFWGFKRCSGDFQLVVGPSCPWSLPP